jgi:hypothetical protein
MMSRATLNQQLSSNERVAIYASWRPDDGHRYFLKVRINLRPRELCGLRTGNIGGAIAGNSAPLADTFVAQIDKAGIPYKITVNVFGSEPIVNLDRTTKRVDPAVNEGDPLGSSGRDPAQSSSQRDAAPRPRINDPTITTSETGVRGVFPSSVRPVRLAWPRWVTRWHGEHRQINRRSACSPVASS